jgi:hypothetical protein
MKPLFIVCEDGTEYLERFERFLGGEFRFQRAGALAQAVSALAQTEQPAGLVLDLDFRRTPVAELVDESGAPLGEAALGEAQRVAAVQGLLILRALRARGVQLPALLCTDIDDPSQLAHVEAELAPVSVVPSSESLPRLAARLRALAKGA